VPITIKIFGNDGDYITAQTTCYYYDSGTDQWKTDGVDTVGHSLVENSVTCQTHHLTSFALAESSVASAHEVSSQMEFGGFDSLKAFTADHEMAFREAVAWLGMVELSKVTVTGKAFGSSGRRLSSEVRRRLNGMKLMVDYTIIGSEFQLEQAAKAIDDCAKDASAFTQQLNRSFVQNGVSTPAGFEVTAYPSTSLMCPPW
jgi:hypothetical protein